MRRSFTERVNSFIARSGTISFFFFFNRFLVNIYPSIDGYSIITGKLNFPLRKNGTLIGCNRRCLIRSKLRYDVDR